MRELGTPERCCIDWTVLTAACGPLRMLDDIDSHVDRTSTKLDKAQRKMAKFIKQNQSEFASMSRRDTSRSGWYTSCIGGADVTPRQRRVAQRERQLTT